MDNYNLAGLQAWLRAQESLNSWGRYLRELGAEVPPSLTNALRNTRGAGPATANANGGTFTHGDINGPVNMSIDRSGGTAVANGNQAPFGKHYNENGRLRPDRTHGDFKELARAASGPTMNAMVDHLRDKRASMKADGTWNSHGQPTPDTFTQLTGGGGRQQPRPDTMPNHRQGGSDLFQRLPGRWGMGQGQPHRGPMGGPGNGMSNQRATNIGNNLGYDTSGWAHNGIPNRRDLRQAVAQQPYGYIDPTTGQHVLYPAGYNPVAPATTPPATTVTQTGTGEATGAATGDAGPTAPTLTPHLGRKIGYMNAANQYGFDTSGWANNGQSRRQDYRQALAQYRKTLTGN